MRLFWRHGYEGVSIGDLIEVIGIAPPSLYAAFGSKAELFREALQRYERHAGSFDLAAFDEAGTLGEAVRRTLRTAVAAVTDPERERGCMISSGMVACGADHAELASELATRRDAMREKLALKLRRWLDEPEATSMARYLAAVMQGLSIQARDGATEAELATVVKEVTAALASRRSR